MSNQKKFRSVYTLAIVVVLALIGLAVWYFTRTDPKTTPAGNETSLPFTVVDTQGQKIREENGYEVNGKQVTLFLTGRSGSIKYVVEKVTQKGTDITIHSVERVPADNCPVTLDFTSPHITIELQNAVTGTVIINKTITKVPC